MTAVAGVARIYTKKRSLELQYSLVLALTFCRIISYPAGPGCLLVICPRGSVQSNSSPSSQQPFLQVSDYYSEQTPNSELRLQTPISKLTPNSKYKLLYSDQTPDSKLRVQTPISDQNPDSKLLVQTPIFRPNS